jgi:hypothetical protein
VILLVGSVAYLAALADPLDVLVILADRGGSLALLMVGALLTIGASLLALGGLGLAIRDVALDARPRPGSQARAGEGRDSAGSLRDDRRRRLLGGGRG